MKRWTHVLMAIGITGCGAAAPAAQARLASSDRSCVGIEGLALEAPTEIPSQWTGSLTMAGEARVRVRWCGQGRVVVETITMTFDGGGDSEWALDPLASALTHGETLDQAIHGTADVRELTIRATARDAAGREMLAEAVTQSVLDPRLVAARDECTAASGTFGPVGMAQTYACDRPTHDAGQRCASSADCEGPCIDDHVEVRANGEAAGCASGQVQEVHVGACYARSLLFGCASRLDEPYAECVTPGPLRGRRIVCVD